MIYINDLRIGNIVYLPSLSKAAYGYENVPFYVEELFIENSEYKVLCHCETKEGYNCTEDAVISEIEPIPLTEELLLKCGFKKEMIVDIDLEHTHVYHNEEMGFLSCNFAYCINNTNDHCEYDNIVELSHPLKWLHQLQNIYYALTGKELEMP